MISNALKCSAFGIEENVKRIAMRLGRGAAETDIEWYSDLFADSILDTSDVEKKSFLLVVRWEPMADRVFLCVNIR